MGPLPPARFPLVLHLQALSRERRELFKLASETLIEPQEIEARGALAAGRGALFPNLRVLYKTTTLAGLGLL